MSDDKSHKVNESVRNIGTATTGLEPQSTLLRERARAVLPGGVNSPVRSFRSVGAEPLVVASASGSTITDVDGRIFDDYVLSWGPMIFGHGDPDVVAAINQQISQGISYGMTCDREVEFAELFREIVPEVEMLRCVSSGTEATMSAIRLARGVTGRNILIKFVGCYHGHGDSLLVQAGSGVATLGIPGSPGIPEAIASQTVALPFNDASALRETIGRLNGEIAAIIVETLPGNMGLVRPAEEFLAALRAAQQDGILLIADEVMTGFRVPQGAAYRMFGLTPDLSTWGKVIGGGLPLAVYGGKLDIMSQIAPTGPVYQAGTLSGNPLAMAAGVAILNKMKANPWEQLGNYTSTLGEGLRGIAADFSVPFFSDSVGSMFGMFFGTDRPHDFASVAKTDHDRFGSWFRYAMDRGILLAPSGFEAGFVSTTHTIGQQDKMLETFRSFCREL